MKTKGKYRSKRKKQLFVKEETASSLAYKPIIVNNIYNLDCIEGMKQILNNSIDVVITDPPFAIEFKAKRSNYNRTQSTCIRRLSRNP